MSLQSGSFVINQNTVADTYPKIIYKLCNTFMSLRTTGFKTQRSVIGTMSFWNARQRVNALLINVLRSIAQT